jgi:hypothetical protein
MAYDSARGKTVMFGGWDTFYLNDTWEYDGVDWVQIMTANAPGLGGGRNMVYDSARGRVVMFGGFNFLSSPLFSDETWEYDGVDWTQMTTTTTPPERSVQAMTYDSTRQKVVMFGGNNTAPGFLSDTWDYGVGVLNSASTSIPASSPTGCNGALVHYTSAVTPPCAGLLASWASGTTAALTVTNLDPLLNLGILVFGYYPINLPIFGGLVIPSPDVVIIIGGSGGVASLSFTVPPGLGGSTFYTQFLGFDSCVGAAGLTFSNGQSHVLP